MKLYKYIQKKLYKLSDADREKLLTLDKEYGELVFMYRDDFNTKDIKNVDSEYDKFMEARKQGKKYFPYIELVGENKFATDGIQERLKRLLVEFTHFNCFLSKYYIELIEDMIHTVDFSLHQKEKYPWYVNFRGQKPSLENLTKAKEMLKQYPFEKVNEKDRNIDGKTAAKMIQQHIDKLGYKWKVKLNDNMIPRMNVDINNTMNVNPNAKFSEIDIEGLKKHEVEGHIGRRYYGLKTGLYLFLMGLKWRNTLDEGLAIWNSIHKCEIVKPNVRPNIALKTIIAYYLNEMDFCDLYDYCLHIAPGIEEKALFKTLLRFKREIQDCSILGGNGDDQSYFCGYQIVKDMTDEQRDDILKWNIGPGQLSELPKIKEFFKVNRFKPLI